MRTVKFLQSFIYGKLFTFGEKVMKKGGSTWHKVKIDKSRAKFPSGVFQKCNMNKEEWPKFSTIVRIDK